MRTQNIGFIAHFLCLFVLMTCNSFAANQQLNLLPQPKQVELGTGQLSLRDGLTVRYSGVHDERVTRAVPRLYDRISQKLGHVVLPKPVVPNVPTLEIVCDKKGGNVQRVTDDESYTLTVTATGATLHAAEPVGVLRGLQTFYQLAFNTADGYGAIPVLKIQDSPRFVWRGLLLDVARHYMPLEQIKREVDGLAAVKMNVLHLHLSDDQSFRMESRIFPELTEKSSHGQFYTQAQIRELIAYAHDRGVRVMPEFDVPGHSTAWLAAFPDLAVKEPDPNETFIQFGGYKNSLDPSNPRLIKVLDRLFGEMAALFPDEYFHIGGDEVDYTYWKQSPSIAALKKKHNLKDEQAVQAYFNIELSKILSKHHKKMMGWNEILHADLPKDTVVHNWVGVPALEQATRRGYSVVVSIGYYLDYYLPAWWHYNVDPLRPDPQTYEDFADAVPNARKNKVFEADRKAAADFKASPEAERLVLGGEAAEWVELVGPWSIDGVIWPRLAAVAERFWSPADVKDLDSLYRRLDAITLELSDLGISPYETLRLLRKRLAGSDEGVQILATFAEAVESKKYYTRHIRQKKDNFYNVNTPANRFVDAVAPESLTAREFHKAVTGWLANRNPQDLAFLKQTLDRWKQNDPQLTRLVTGNPRLAETKLLIESLRGHIDAASDAIAYLERDEQPPAGWKQAQGAVLDAKINDTSDLQLAFACDVKRLVNVASGAKDVKTGMFCVGE